MIPYEQALEDSGKEKLPFLQEETSCWTRIREGRLSAKTGYKWGEERKSNK